MASTILGRVGLVLKGEWAETTAYKALDVVSHNGYAWAAKIDSTGVEPSTTNSTEWQPLAESATVLAQMESYTQQAASSAEAGTKALANQAPVFSDSTAYSVGSIVTHDGDLYAFTSDHAAGAWTGTDATKITVGDEIGKLNETIDNVDKAIYDTTTNVLDIQLTNGRLINREGKATSHNSSSYTNYIPVTGGATITLNGVLLNSLRSVVAYSKAADNAQYKLCLNDGTVQTGVFTAILPEWAKFVRATGAVDGTMTGTETTKVNRIYDVVKDYMTNSPFRAVLPYPVEMPALPDIVIYATPIGYGTPETAGKYKLTVSGTVYVDGDNGDDSNDGTSVNPLETISAALTKDANTIIVYGTGTYDTITINKSINLIAEDHITIRGAAIAGTASVYVENITFDGTNLANACSLIVSENTEKPQFCASNCVFEKANTNGLTIKGEVSVRLFDCIGRNNKADGFNYHRNTSVNSAAPNVLEVRCEGYGNGTGNTSPNSENGSTAHNGTQIIRLNGYYHNNYGGNVADTGNTITWCINCQAAYSEPTPTNNNANCSDFWAYSGAVMYLENCSASGTTADIWAEEYVNPNTGTSNPAFVYYAGGVFDESTFHNVNSTITTFTRNVDVKYVL